MVGAADQKVLALAAFKAFEDIFEDDELWEEMREQVVRRVEPVFLEAFLVGSELGSHQRPSKTAQRALGMRQEQVLPFDFEGISGAADSLIGNYTDGWWQQFSATTQTRLRAAIQRASTEGLTVNEVISDLGSIFGDARARTIAVSEVTNLMGQGAQETYRLSGYTHWEWRTVRDSLVDPLCQSRDKKQFPMAVKFERAHPNCRCWPVPAGEPGAAIAKGPEDVARSGAEVREELRQVALDAQVEIANANEQSADFLRQVSELNEESTRPATTDARKLAIDNQINRLTKQAASAKSRAASVRFNLNRDLVERLHAPEPARFIARPMPTNTPANTLFEWEEGVENFRRIVGSGNGLDSLRIDFDLLPDGSRAFFNQRPRFAGAEPEGVLHLTIADESANVTHELGHWLEANNPPLQEAVVEFVRSRVDSGDVAVLLSELTGQQHFRDDELSVGEFIDPYMGKVYPPDAAGAGTGTASEIVSMGLQLMVEDPLAFATADPQMFDWLWFVLRSGLIA